MVLNGKGRLSHDAGPTYARGKLEGRKIAQIDPRAACSTGKAWPVEGAAPVIRLPDTSLPLWGPGRPQAPRPLAAAFWKGKM